MASLKQSLKDAVKKLAYSTSVDHLKKSGVKNVNVLGIDRIVSLIDAAVSRSLRHRLLASEREEVVDATKEEFLKLLKSNQDLQRDQEELRKEKQTAQGESDRLRLELQQLSQMLEERLAEAETQERARYRAEDIAIDSDVDRLFAQLGDLGQASSPEMRERVRELIGDLVGRERDLARREVEAARSTEFENMQRRIAKLQRSLDVTEKRLVEVSQMKDVEDGIASIYREVQGLSSGAKDSEKKHELMANIFQANLALQRGEKT